MLGNGDAAIGAHGIIEGLQIYPAGVTFETVKQTLIEQVVAS